MDIVNKLKLVVPKRVLFFIAASVWGFASSRILKIGFIDVFNNTKSYWINFIIGFTGFYFFFKYVFYKMYLKHTKRIINSENDKLFILSFFDLRGYLIMGFMITFGVTLRKLNVIPSLYMGTFYLTLGLSLLSAAVCFLYSGIRYDYMRDLYLDKEDSSEQDIEVLI